jgi:hypothetical protein
LGVVQSDDAWATCIPAPICKKLSSGVFAANKLYIVEHSTEKFDVVSHDMIGSGDPGEQLTWISSRPPGDASALVC